MSTALRQSISRGDYEVDSDAVAVAMISRARTLRAARRGLPGSQVLVSADSIEIRRAGPRELDVPCPLEGAA